jgi:hypothetical protein
MFGFTRISLDNPARGVILIILNIVGIKVETDLWNGRFFL